MSDCITKDLIIIGAGPAGLKAAQEATARGLDYLVLEKGAVGSGWRSVSPKMRMLSPCHPQRDWTSLDYHFPIWKMDVMRPYCTAGEFVQYLESFATHYKLRIQTGATVDSVQYDDDKFLLHTAEGQQYCAPNLLVASGVFGNPYIPDIPGVADNPYVMHSNYYRGFEEFKHKRVLVIGAGNSAAEIVNNLAGRAMVYMASRGELEFFSQTQNLKNIRGISESYLKELITMELVRYYSYHQLQRVEANRAYFKDRMLEVDKIIFATGYRPLLKMLHSLELRTNKYSCPEITFGGESIQYPGLFFAGPLAFSTPSSVVIHGFIKNVGNTIDHIAQRIKNQPQLRDTGQNQLKKSS